MRTFSKFLFLSVLLVFVSNCARTGTPEGGPKDEEAPLFVTANPPYESIKFDKKEIKIDFNEYVVLKELNKQLVVSPPMKNPPLISPQGSASKFIKIEILDTLKLNTTYIFNFGNSIQDNNEANKLENFKYVFSTGDYIDSLTTKGSVRDAKLLKKPKDVSVLLYRIDSAFNDSIIYKEKPNYITNNIDSIGFKFTNLRKGKYLMLALQESVTDYIFNPKTDKIGFATNTIQLPKDSIINKPIILFKEEQPYQFKRGKEITKGKIEFGFEGDAKNMRIKMLSKVPEDFKSVSKFETEKDTLNFWFTPFETDSILFTVTNKRLKVIDTFNVKSRKVDPDSLRLQPNLSGSLDFNTSYHIAANIPLTELDSSKISIMNSDSTQVTFAVTLDSLENKVDFDFKTEPSQSYSVSLLPGAVTDFFGTENDSINYNLSTKSLADYGNLSLTIDGKVQYPMIVQLTNEKGEIQREIYATEEQLFEFNAINPGMYLVRVIFDTNANRKWDPGNLLQKLQPEKVIYYPGPVEMRANWEKIETFTLTE